MKIFCLFERKYKRFIKVHLYTPNVRSTRANISQRVKMEDQFVNIYIQMSVISWPQQHTNTGYSSRHSTMQTNCELISNYQHISVLLSLLSSAAHPKQLSSTITGLPMDCRQRQHNICVILPLNRISILPHDLAKH